MWLIELIIVIILISNDFSFLQIMWIMIIFMPIFYGLILPMILYAFKGKDKKQDIEVDKENSEEIKGDNTYQEAIEEMIDMEENITQKRIIIMKSLYEWIDDKDYQGNIDYDIENWEALQEMFLPYREDYQVYNVIIWASYQEIWDVESAQRYFRNYCNTLEVSDLVADELDNKDKNILLLMSELEKIGLTYKMKK